MICLINKIKLKIRNYNEEKYLDSLRKRIENKDVTIISNNCTAGVIYHNLGLQFRSPTINLSIRGEDYLRFVRNLDYYVQCEIEEIEKKSVSFPVGRLITQDKDHLPITVYFDHYESFQEAVYKWKERIKRINFDNVVFLWEFYDELYDYRLIREFDKLPFYKMALLHHDVGGVKSFVKLQCYETDYRVAKIFEYDRLTGKRFLEEFDYVSWLNKANCELP